MTSVAESLDDRSPMWRFMSDVKMVWFAMLALGLLAAAYLLLGFYTLLVDTSFSYPVDLRLRWIETSMIARGENPQDHTYPAELLPSLIAAQKNVHGSYPPWSYATSLVLAPPIEWGATRISFALVNLFALVGIGYWACRQGAEWGAPWGAATMVSVFAIFPVCVCLSYGQYSIFVLAMILVCLELLRRDHMFSAGVALGIATVKPQLAGLFFLVPMIYPFSISAKFRFLVGAATYTAIASFAIAWYVGTTPWEMLGGTANESVKFYRLSNNPLVIWAAGIFGFSLGSKLLAACVAGLCALLLWATRRQNNLLTAFSICTILAMYWSYSRHYDLVLFTIPLVTLLGLSATGVCRAATLAFLLMGLMLWLPIRIEMSRWLSVEFALALANLAALFVVVRFGGTSELHSAIEGGPVRFAETRA